MTTRFIAALAALAPLLAQPALAAGGQAPWGYGGATGPDAWGRLAPAYATCAAGKNQSPIDVTQPVASPLFELEGRRIPLPSAISHNSELRVSGESYKLLQVHFHSPSEHAVDGTRYPMEAHLVHINDQRQLAVVGVLFREGARNPLIDAVWGHMPASAGPVRGVAEVRVNPADLLPAERAYAHYRGSLTTPPCSEGVRWFVMREAAEISRDQVERFLRVVGENARPLQPLNNRFLLETP